MERFQEELTENAQVSELGGEAIDVTLPGYIFPQGRPHPLRRVQQEMEEIAVRMGFSVLSGPELESDYYNFEALNLPKGHPARDAQDTLYITENLLLRTHTSPVQIRTMERHQPPIRIVVPGRVYRRDSVDATHSPMFHQMEGLMVDTDVTMADLKTVLKHFATAFLGDDVSVRFRQSFFQIFLL